MEKKTYLDPSENEIFAENALLVCKGFNQIVAQIIKTEMIKHRDVKKEDFSHIKKGLEFVHDFSFKIGMVEYIDLIADIVINQLEKYKHPDRFSITKRLVKDILLKRFKETYNCSGFDS